MFSESSGNHQQGSAYRRLGSEMGPVKTLTFSVADVRRIPILENQALLGDKEKEEC